VSRAISSCASPQDIWSYVCVVSYSRHELLYVRKSKPSIFDEMRPVTLWSYKSIFTTKFVSLKT